MRFFAIVLLAWVLGTVSANAQYATRDPNNPTCPVRTIRFSNPMSVSLEVVDGSRILVIDGVVGAGSAAQIIQAINTNQPIDEIWIHSPGGIASEGNRIAQAIRRTNIPVRVPNDWWCVSACNFIFFGGRIRYIDPNGVFGVHMATVVNNEQYMASIEGEDLATVLAGSEQEMALLTAYDFNVMLEMGISRDLLTDIMYRQKAHATAADPSTYRCLTRAEMRRYNVINVE